MFFRLDLFKTDLIRERGNPELKKYLTMYNWSEHIPVHGHVDHSSDDRFNLVMFQRPQLISGWDKYANPWPNFINLDGLDFTY